MPLFASPPALELLLALEHRPDGARLAELAEAVGRPLTTVQKATRSLTDERLATRDRGRRPRYRARRDAPVREPLLDLAARYLPLERLLHIAFRANPAVEFAARDRRGYLIVESAHADPGQLVALEESLQRVARARTLPAITRYEHDALVRRLLEDRSPRRRASRAATLKGSLARSFPDRAARRRRPARVLARPHRGLGRIPRRALQRIARRYGLRRLALFGSAVREDFGPDSDVDVLVEPREDARLSLFDLVTLEDELERLFERDVDAVTPGGLRQEVRERVRREAITIYG